LWRCNLHKMFHRSSLALERCCKNIEIVIGMPLISEDIGLPMLNSMRGIWRSIGIICIRNTSVLNNMTRSTTDNRSVHVRLMDISVGVGYESGVGFQAGTASLVGS
uniref:Pentatricopeptide repeat-containing protein n=1 Tax=Hymenolepis diminuta TaxID=6216 RepID=A0A0R3SDY3_HYMDI